MRFFSFALAAGAMLAQSAHAAEPFEVPPGNDPSLACLTSAIYHESAREPLDGQRAVARVVFNRLADPAYPKTVCGVIYQGSSRSTGCQFTFTCDGALFRRTDPRLWAQAATVAAEALANPGALPELGALHYHANYVRPYWAASMREETRIGRHIFYAAGRATRVRPPPVGRIPTAATFSAWGLPIARVRPDTAGDVIIDPAAVDPG